MPTRRVPVHRPAITARLTFASLYVLHPVASTVCHARIFAQPTLDRFYGWTTIQSNTAGVTGGGMSLLGNR